MDEMTDPPPPVGAWKRPATRRAALSAAVATAAVATAAVVLGRQGDGTRGPAAPSPAAGATPGSSDAQAGGQPIADPRRRAAHLLRRAGFGATQAEIDEFSSLSISEAVDRLVDFAAIDNSGLDRRLAAANLNLTDFGAGLAIDMQRWWFMRMAYTARPLEERMTYIWHGLLTSQLSKIGNQRAKLLVRQNELFRSMALGRYDDLLQAVSRDPAMLYYLDTIESTKDHPNENYARELMELFSMGVGNYTETDVREAARAFTGWRLTPPPRIPLPAGATQAERNAAQQQAMAAWEPEFVLQSRLHDDGAKVFLGRSGNLGGEDIVAAVMEQPATGRYITRRLFTELANDDPRPETLEALLQTWDETGHDVREVVRAILKSDEFNSEKSYRARVRSPVELVASMVRSLRIDTDFRQLLQVRRGSSARATNAYRAMDQALFEPHSVAGWPGGANWLSSGAFFARANFVDQVLFPGGRPLPLPALAGASGPAELVDLAVDLLVDGEMAQASREAIIQAASEVPGGAERAAVVAYLVLAGPEYQLA